MKKTLIAAAALTAGALLSPSHASISGPYPLLNDTALCWDLQEIERYIRVKDDMEALQKQIDRTFSTMQCWQARKGSVHYLDERRAPYHYCLREQGSTPCAWAILLPEDAQRFNSGG